MVLEQARDPAADTSQSGYQAGMFDEGVAASMKHNAQAQFVNNGSGRDPNP